MRQLHVTCLVLWSWYVSQGCHAWGVGATDGYVSRSMPVPENPDYSEQLYSADSFKPEPFIADAETWCRSNLPGLPKASRLMCETFPRSTVLMAYQGTRAGVHNCREAFANERWRCEGLSKYAESTGLLSLFEEAHNPIMGTHSREQALVEAFVGAGAAVTVARACGDGYLSTECSCGDTSPSSSPKDHMSPSAASQSYVATNVQFASSNVQMGGPVGGQQGLLLEGCNHNFKVGYNLAREFLTTLFKSLAKKQKHLFALTRHNMALGVVTAMEKHQKKCACHGESGSCSLKTCWVQPRDMKSIAAALKGKKDYSQQVDVTSERTLLKASVRDSPLYLSSFSAAEDEGRVATGDTRQRKVALPSLQDSQFGAWYPVHTNKSYNYCYPNPITQGMQGRECPAWKSESMCDVYCCLPPSALSSGSHVVGSMIEMREVTLQYDCDCKFSFCCSVKCQVCQRNQTQRVCRDPQQQQYSQT